MNLKRQQIRSKQYTDAAKGRSCIQCVADDGTTVPAHYSAKYAEKLGKGAGIKAHDIFIADLCLACHTAADSYKGGRNYRNGARFLIAIFDTQCRRRQHGYIKRKDGQHFAPYDALSDDVFRLITKLYEDTREALPDETFEPLFDALIGLAQNQLDQIWLGEIIVKGMK